MERRRKVVPRRAKKETDNNTFLMGLVRIVKTESQVIVLALPEEWSPGARRARSAGACQRHSTLAAPKGALLHSGSPRVRRSARCVEQHHITSLLHVSSVSVSISWGRLLGRLRLVPFCRFFVGILIRTHTAFHLRLQYVKQRPSSPRCEGILAS